MRSPSTFEEFLSVEHIVCSKVLLHVREGAHVEHLKVSEVVFNEDGIVLERRSANLFPPEVEHGLVECLVVLRGDRFLVRSSGFGTSGTVDAWPAVEHFDHDGNMVATGMHPGVIGVGAEQRLQPREDGYARVPTGLYHGIRLALRYADEAESGSE